MGASVFSRALQKRLLQKGKEIDLAFSNAEFEFDDEAAAAAEQLEEHYPFLDAATVDAFASSGMAWDDPVVQDAAGQIQADLDFNGGEGRRPATPAEKLFLQQYGQSVQDLLTGAADAAEGANSPGRRIGRGISAVGGFISDAASDTRDVLDDPASAAVSPFARAWSGLKSGTSRSGLGVVTGAVHDALDDPAAAAAARVADVMGPTADAALKPAVRLGVAALDSGPQTLQGIAASNYASVQEHGWVQGMARNVLGTLPAGGMMQDAFAPHELGVSRAPQSFSDAMTAATGNLGRGFATSDLGVIADDAFSDVGQGRLPSVDTGGGWFIDPESDVGAERLERRMDMATIGDAPFSIGGLTATTLYEPGSREHAMVSGLVDIGLEIIGPGALAADNLILGATRGRKTINPENALKMWEGSSGRRINAALTDSTDFSYVDRALGHQADPAVVAAIVDSVDPDEVSRLVLSQLGAEVTGRPSLPRFRMGVDNFVTDTAPKVRRAFGQVPGDSLSIHNPRQRIDEARVFMRNSLADSDEISEFTYRLAKAENESEVLTVAQDMVATSVYRAAQKAETRLYTGNWGTAAIDAQVAAGTPLLKALDDSQYRQLARMWADNAQTERAYYVHLVTDPHTGGKVPSHANFFGESANVPHPQLHAEMLNSNIPMPNHQAMQDAFRRPIWQSILSHELVEGLPYVRIPNSILMNITQLWKRGKLARFGYPLKITIEEQGRLAVSGYDGIWNHPFSYLSYVGAESRGLIRKPTTAINTAVRSRLGARNLVDEVMGVRVEGRVARGQAPGLDPADVIRNPPTRNDVARALRKEYEVSQEAAVRMADAKLAGDKKEISRILRTERDWTRAASDPMGHALVGQPSFRAAQYSGSDLFRTKAEWKGKYTDEFTAYQKADESVGNYVYLWVDEFVKLSSDRPVSMWARADSFDEAAQTFWDDMGDIRRQIVSNKETDLDIVNSRAQADAYLRDSVAGRAQDLTGGDAELIEALGSGRLDGHRAWKDGSTSHNPAFTKAAKERYDKMPEVLAGRKQQSAKRAATNHSVGRLAGDWFFSELVSKMANNFTRNPLYKQVLWREMERMALLLDPADMDKLRRAARKANLPKHQMDEIVKRANAATPTGRTLKLSEANQLAHAHALDEVKEILFDTSLRNQFMNNHQAWFPFGDAYIEVTSRYLKWFKENPNRGNKIAGVVNGEDDEEEPFFREDRGGTEVVGVPGSGSIASMLLGVDGYSQQSSLKGFFFGAQLGPGVGMMPQYAAAMMLPDESWANRLREDMAQGFGVASDPREDLPAAVMDVLPSWASYGIDIWANGVSDQAERVLAGHRIDIFNMMLANGDITWDDLSTPTGLETAMRRVEKGAFRTGLLRVFGRMTLVSAPQHRFQVEAMDGEIFDMWAVQDLWNDYLDEHGPQEGIPKFIDDWGLDIAAFAGGRKSRSLLNGGGTPYYQTGIDWVSDNDFAKIEYPTTFGFFAPAQGEDEEFKHTEYANSFIHGEREYLELSEFIALRQNWLGNVVYHEVERQTLELTGGSRTREVQQRLNIIRSALEEQFPGFKADPVGLETAVKNETQLDELVEAANDERLSETALFEPLNAYLAVRETAIAASLSMDPPLSTGVVSADAMAPYRDRLFLIGTAIAAESPTFADVWDRVLFKEFSGQYREDQKKIGVG